MPSAVTPCPATANLPGMENEQVEPEQVEIEEELLVEEISIDGMCGVY